MKEITKLLVFLLAMHRDISLASCSVVKFVLEEVPAGKALDEEKLLETKTFHPGIGENTLCSIHCRSSLSCRGFIVSNHVCKTFSEIKIVTDTSVSLQRLWS